MSAECPLSYIKAIQCNGPTKVSRGNYLCPRGDSICQSRLDGRTFETIKPVREVLEDQTFNFVYRDP